MKNSSDSIGNRTRFLPACSAVPQPTAPPRTPLYLTGMCVISLGVNRSERDVDHSYLSSAEVKNKWISTFVPSRRGQGQL